jgi:hypothetical protein
MQLLARVGKNDDLSPGEMNSLVEKNCFSDSFLRNIQPDSFGTISPCYQFRIVGGTIGCYYDFHFVSGVILSEQIFDFLSYHRFLIEGNYYARDGWEKFFLAGFLPSK